MGTAPARETGLTYWLVVLVLFGLGFLTIFSLGLYFWFTAVVLIVLSPLRSRRRVFLAGLGLSLGFLVAYVLVAPWGCAQSFASDALTGEPDLSPVVCTSPIGVEYSGPDPFEPSRTPALIAGSVAAVVGAAVAWGVAKPEEGRATVPADAGTE